MTPTRAVLIILLIGGVYKVSTMVTEPPKGPPEQPKKAAEAAQTGSLPKPSQSDMVAKTKERMAEMKRQAENAKTRADLEKKLSGDKPIVKTDDISSDYFRTVSMGKKGIDETTEEADRAKRITDEVNKRMASLPKGKTLPIVPDAGIVHEPKTPPTPPPSGTTAP
jgi:hypothetical protein